MKTNKLEYKARRTADGVDYSINIKLADDCGNGHQDFSVTGYKYERGKPHIEKYMIGGGAIGDEIAEIFPEFSLFARLHLCDCDGVPMYAVENGMFHVENGEPVEKIAKWYNMSTADAKALAKCRDKVQYFFTLEKRGIIAKWKADADAAIKQLEELTGNEFVNTSKKSQLTRPTEEEIQTYRERVQSGYYTAKAESARAKAEKLAKYEKLKINLSQEFDRKIKKITDEFEIDGYFLRTFIALGIGPRKCGNYLYYDHLQEIRLNFHGYDKFDDAEVEKIISKFNRDKKRNRKELRNVKSIGIYKA